MKTLINVKLSFKVSFVFLLCSLYCHILSAQCNVAGGCELISNGAYADITKHSQPCKRVTNNTGATIMVPHSTAAEWSGSGGFLSNVPTNVTVVNCPTCSGYSYGGYCYHAVLSNTCNSVCASKGGVNASGMAYITTHASGRINCENTYNALFTPAGWTAVDEGSSFGCYNLSGKVLYRSSLGYNAGQTLAGAVCACNN